MLDKDFGSLSLGRLLCRGVMLRKFELCFASAMWRAAKLTRSVNEVWIIQDLGATEVSIVIIALRLSY